jgi:hypothetical protein
MRSLSFLACSVLAVGAIAQSPLATLTGGTNLGNTGGGLYFNLQVNTTITINRIDTLCGNAVGQGTGPAVLEIYLGPQTYVGNVQNPALWALVGTANGTTGINTVANFVLSQPFALAPGNYGVALKSQAIVTAPNVQWGFGYTNGVTCTSTTVPGACTNSLFSNAELTLRAGAAQNAFLTGGVFTPRIFNGAIHYTLGGTPVAIAAWENYGDGCNKRRTSFNELFPNPGSIDVANTTVTMGINGSSGYDVVAGGTPYTAPSITAGVGTFATGDAFVLASTVLGGPLPFQILHPDGVGGLAVASDLEINADGFILPVVGSQPWSAPTVPGFNSGAARWAPHWKNMNVVAGGNITVEIEALTGALVVSWNGVNDNTTTSTFQVAFSATGSVEYRYQTMSILGGGGFPCLIGWTPGASLNNEVDVSVPPFSTQGTDNQEITQEMNNRPRLGTTPSFVASNLSGAPFGASLLSFLQINPGFDLGAFGMPGCLQHVGIPGVDAGVAQIVFPVGGQLTQAFPIPNTIAFNNLLVFAQTAAFAAGQNPIGVIWSNGTRMTVGSL